MTEQQHGPNAELQVLSDLCEQFLDTDLPDSNDFGMFIQHSGKTITAGIGVNAP
jgi:hypothetical protein